MHKISKVFFSLTRTRPCDESSPSRGRLTSDDHDGADRREAVTVGRTVSWDRGADPRTWTSALQQGVPPYREQTKTVKFPSQFGTAAAGI